jgi:hypothetical protein
VLGGTAAFAEGAQVLKAAFLEEHGLSETYLPPVVFSADIVLD